MTVAGPPQGKTAKAGTITEDDKTSEIFHAAARIFCDKGFHATSINEIASEVHLTKAGLYYYIKGKQDLLYRIMDFAMNVLETQVIAVAEEQSDALARLRTVVEQHCRLVTDAGSQPLAILVNELEGLTEAQRTEIAARQKAYVNFLRETLDILRSEGRLQAVDSTTGAFTLLGMMLWVSRWYDASGRMRQQEVVEQITQMALRGVIKEAVVRESVVKNHVLQEGGVVRPEASQDIVSDK